MSVKTRIIDYFTSPSGRQPARDWLDSIKDKITQAIIYKRIRQAGLGNFGKNRSVGHGVHELKIDYGPGYRVYYGIHKDELILLLMGGSKRTQNSDIEKAQTNWMKWINDQDQRSTGDKQ